MRPGKKLTSGLIGTLSFVEAGQREHQISRTRAHTSEKRKGVQMIRDIKDRFCLSDRFIKDVMEEELYIDLREQGHLGKKGDRKAIWTRDERGQIKSPFAQKVKW